MESNHYRTTRMKILAAMCLVPLVPFALAFWVGFTYFTHSVRNSTIAKMERIVSDHGHMIEAFLAERRADLKFVADSYDFVTLSDDKALADVLARLQEKSNAFVDLGVFDRTGLHVAYVGPYEQLVGRNYHGETWFTEVLQTGNFVSDIYLGFRKVPHFVLARAQMEDGHIWVLRATIDTLLFSDVVERVRIGRTGEAYLLNKEGLFQTRRRSGGDLMEKDPDAGALLSRGEGQSAFVHKGGSGESYLYVTTWIIDGKWLLVVRQSAADAFSTLHRAGLWVLVIAVLGGAVIVVTAFYMSGRMVARLSLVDHEKSDLNQQLVMAGRLAEIGEMSSGFAHEINNPLQIIRAETSLVETLLPDIIREGRLEGAADVAELADSIRQIETQVDRCGEITAAILKFARQKEIAVQRVDLARFLPQILHMVAKKAEVEGIRLILDVPQGDSFQVSADPGELQQVLLNLVNNAIHAVTEAHASDGRGEVALSLSRAGGRVSVCVTDNGTGMSEEIMGKIFTPFFSTKPVGQGTGLGLSICYGIVDKMGGAITVKSEMGKGSVFAVALPEQK